MRRYNPSSIEPKWQKKWETEKSYEVSEDVTKQKLYISPMFPYPSGAGMHAGHAFEHAIVDAIARFHRQQGLNVMSPMGWDAFGLPTENYAIKSGISPGEATSIFIARFKKQIKMLGSSIDWSREINTSDPNYYKWTQWIFTQLFERGLAYQKEALQWWCPVDKTVLANEQVEGGRCWRCGTEVVKKSMNQWFFKITAYADALLDELPALDWPGKIKTAQTNWIGRSTGAEIEFSLPDKTSVITVFSTRPDTIFGATFLVLAPEHPLVKSLTNAEAQEPVEAYVKNAVKKSEIERMNDSREKTGVFTGSYAINPATGEKIPIWVADYVLAGYGTGAIMAVPAHDQRDYEFADKYQLPIVEVVAKLSSHAGVYSGEGTLMNSGAYDGKTTSQAREEIVAWLEQEGTGRAKTTYKMRDWLISRQRYWGVPIPIVHCPDHGAVAVPQDQLPVVLPEVKDYAPKGDGQSTLAGVEDWVNTTCPICGNASKRETDTMDGYACSSWYLLRYADPRNSDRAWDPAKANYWAPLDFYVGGDHAVAHLLYVRFWTHVFNEMGLTGFKEPVKKLVYHGYINAPDGAKMSKSKGNVIDPLEIIEQGYGADALRTYMLFMGPIELDAPWDPRGIGGVYRFLNRVWVLAQEFIESSDKNTVENDAAVRQIQHATIKKVTDDYRRLSFNTAISSLMQYVNELYKLKTTGFSDEAWREGLGSLVRLLAPLAPHMSAELWQQLGNQIPLEAAGWPTWDDKLIASAKMNIVVQVNGKVRATLTFPKDAAEAEVTAVALQTDNVVKYLGNTKPARIVYVSGRLLNIVT